jgi:hypothetical protein
MKFTNFKTDGGLFIRCFYSFVGRNIEAHELQPSSCPSRRLLEAKRRKLPQLNQNRFQLSGDRQIMEA